MTTPAFDGLLDGPESASMTIVLAHGAGAPMDSPFMNEMARGLANRGHRVARFEFDYMRARRSGRRPGPDRQPVLLEHWRKVIESLGGGSRLVIGGKSMGGRMASMVADETGARGLVCLGYPFHPPGSPEKLRVAHLEHLTTPALIVQGTRDTFGTREEVADYRLSSRIRVEWIEGGNHSFEQPRRGTEGKRNGLETAIELVHSFVSHLG